jgi:opacity protein-like surface antigen
MAARPSLQPCRQGARHRQRPPLALPAAGLLLSLLPALALPAAAEPAAPEPARALPQAPAAGAYLRLGGGLDWPDASVIRDGDGCASIQPPALFGCGAGDDGRSLAARGSFQQTPVLEAGLGYRFSPWLRAEALLSWRPQLDYSGQSNFIGAGTDQPVSAAASSLAGFGVAYVDLPRLAGVQPFLGAGLGVARNRLRSVTYSFPLISAGATTSTPEGSSSDLAWLLTAGLSVPLSERLSLDVAYRFTDLGSLTSPSGAAEVVRPTRIPSRRTIPIASTSTDLQTQGLQVGLRYAF